MKITLKTDQKSYVLAGGTAVNEEPTHISVTAERTLQSVKAVRAASVQTYDRGNLQVRLVFEVGRLHNDQSAAMEHMLVHASEIAHAHGEVLIQSEGSRVRTLTLESATLTSVQTHYKGNASYTTYEIYGGRLHVNA